MAVSELDAQVLEACLSAPWPVLVRDGDGSAFWINRCLARIVGIGCGVLEAGHIERIAGSDYGALLHWEAQCVTVGSGRIWERTRVVLGKTGWEAHYFGDVTEQESLRRELASLENQVRMLEVKDAESGLLNRHAIFHAVDAQLSRSRRYGNPLAVVLLRLTPPRAVRDSGLNLRALSEELNSRLRWADQIGRLDACSFLLVLPETTGAEAASLATRLTGDRVGVIVREAGLKLDALITDWQRGDDARKLLQRLGEAFP
ncbi:MAG: GGDEF domain-containing protein [Methylococcaceae bacterium]|nr:GGDEF domain-containing protein [Methylococcaceae bacterium]